MASSSRSRKRPDESLTHEDCNKIIELKSQSQTSKIISPLSSKPITINGPEYNRIMKLCDELTNASLIQAQSSSMTSSQANPRANQQSKSKKETELVIIRKWIQNPLIDPETNEPIEPSIIETSRYATLYKKAIARKISIRTLPKKHLLFGDKCDVLYYIYDNTNNASKSIKDANMKEIAETIHKWVHKNLPKVEEYKRTYLDDKYINHYLEIYILMEIRNTYHAFFLYFIEILSFILYKFEDTKLDKIKKEFFLHKQRLELLKIMVKLFDIYDHCFDEDIFKIISEDINIKNNPNSQNLFNNVKSTFYKSDNIIQILLDLYDELYKMLNYRTDTTKSPFVLNDVILQKIPDPVNEMLEDLGIQNIDNLFQQPEPRKNFFDSKKEYEEAVETYLQLSKEYNDAKKEYIKEYEKWENLPKDQRTSSPPMNPKMPEMLINNKTITKPKKIIVPRDQLKQHIFWVSSKEYKKYQKTKKKVQELINLGLSRLISKAKYIKQSPDFDKFPLLQKDRKYFEENLINKEDEDNPNKCINNVALIDDDDLDDSYLLAKMQLLFPLTSITKRTDKTTGEKFEIKKTQCFYAPTLYNTIVENIYRNAKDEELRNKTQAIKDTVINPITKDPINRADIERLTQMMEIFYPDLVQIPSTIHTNPSHDKRLKLGVRQFLIQGRRQYSDIFLYRAFNNINIYIKHICCIYMDFEIHETGDASLTSDIALHNIFGLFDNWKLIKSYMPPYNINGQYTDIDFSEFQTYEQWEKYIYDGTYKEKFTALANKLSNARRYA